jgi:hypothetical protein
VLSCHRVEALAAQGRAHDRHPVREGLEDLHPRPAAVPDGDQGDPGSRQLRLHIRDRPDDLHALCLDDVSRQSLDAPSDEAQAGVRDQRPQQRQHLGGREDRGVDVRGVVVGPINSTVGGPGGLTVPSRAGWEAE